MKNRGMAGVFGLFAVLVSCAQVVDPCSHSTTRVTIIPDLCSSGPPSLVLPPFGANPGRLTVAQLPLPSADLVLGQNVLFHAHVSSVAESGRALPVQFLKTGFTVSLSLPAGMSGTAYGRDWHLEDVRLRMGMLTWRPTQLYPGASTPETTAATLLVFRMVPIVQVDQRGIELTLEGTYHGPVRPGVSLHVSLNAGLPAFGARATSGALTPENERYGDFDLIGPHLYTGADVCPAAASLTPMNGLVWSYTLWSSDLTADVFQDCRAGRAPIWHNSVRYAAGTDPGAAGAFTTLFAR